MTANATVRARIDEQTKTEAAAVLKAMGLTVSDAFRLMMVRIAREKALPFEPLVPNEETIEAMRAARRGELVTVGRPERLLAKRPTDGPPVFRSPARRRMERPPRLASGPIWC